MNILRFACGAESPPFEGSFQEWVRSQIKDLKGYALGHRRKDGRHRVMVWDLDNETLTPRLPDGTPAPCLSCPCPKEAGRREVVGPPKRSSPFRQIKVLCYPEEVPAPEVKDRSPAERTGLGDATRKVASATPDVAGATPRVAEITSCFLHGDYTGQPECPKCLETRRKR